MPFTAQLSERLRAAGIRVFFDERELQQGGAFDEAIRRAVVRSRAFLFVSSPKSVQEGSYALTELTWAIQSGRDLFGVCERRHDRVVPPPAIVARTLIRSEGDRIAATVGTMLGVCSRARYRIVRRLGLMCVVVAAIFAVLHRYSIRTAPSREQSRSKEKLLTIGTALSTLSTPAALEPPPPEMIRIAEAVLSVGIGTVEREVFLRWCARNESDSKNCEQMLGRMEPRSGRVETFDIDRLELSEDALALWLTDQIRTHAASVSGAEVRRQSDGVVLWVPACHGLSRYRIADGTIRHATGKGDSDTPAVCVSAHAAAWYCDSHDKRLPSDEEWELAAGGASKRWLTWDSVGQANVGCADAIFGRFDGGPCAKLPRRPEPSTAYGKDRTPEGVINLGGNVSEWVERQTGTGITFLARGGSWSGLAIDLHPTKVMRINPSEARYATVGFRCTRTPKKVGGS